MLDASSAIPFEPKGMFLSSVSQRVLASLFRVILQSYGDAAEYCYANFRPRQAKDLSGHQRRAKIEDEWVGAALRFKSELAYEEVAYKHETGSYVELSCNNVRMTQSCVLHTDALPRKGEFRQMLAAKSHQYGLFPQAEESSPDDNSEKYLYAIVIHGVHKKAKRREKCSFAWVRFPTANCRGYYSDRIDLFQMFPSIAAEFQPSEEQQTTDVKITPKRKRKAAGE